MLAKTQPKRIRHEEVTLATGDVCRSKEQDAEVLEQFALRLINAQDEERQRISQEIHDDLGNRIALMALSIRQVIKQSSDRSIVKDLNEVFEQVTGLAGALRDLSHGLYPPLLRQVGIRVALKSLREKFEKTNNIRTRLVTMGDLTSLPDETVLCIFRITQECLQNVAKHSGARNVSIALSSTPRQIELKISDDGHGFTRTKVRPHGLGLLSMEARALSLGGELTVRNAPGEGTEIRLTVPCRKV